jgi:hypothetical protein
VAVLLTHAGGTPEPWPGDLREALMTAGPQRPELIAEG